MHIVIKHVQQVTNLVSKTIFSKECGVCVRVFFVTVTIMRIVLNNLGSKM